MIEALNVFPAQHRLTVASKDVARYCSFQLGQVSHNAHSRAVSALLILIKLVR